MTDTMPIMNPSSPDTSRPATKTPVKSVSDCCRDTKERKDESDSAYRLVRYDSHKHGREHGITILIQFYRLDHALHKAN